MSTYLRYGVSLGIAAALIFGSLIGYQSCRKAEANTAETQVHIESGAANVHTQQAQASDAVALGIKAKNEAREKLLAVVMAERDTLLRRLASIKPSSNDPNLAGLPSIPADDPRDALIAKDAEVIQAQADHITGLGTMVSALTISRDEWKATAEARERQALAQEVATKAWKQSVTTSRWRGRIEGFAFGVAAGFVGGRR